MRAILLPALPVALAIAIFGTIFGAAAGALFGPGLAVLSSAIIFSGTLQFAAVGLLLGGAGPWALIAAAATLNARHLLLGAALRPRLAISPVRRAVLAWFMIDESFGLTMAAKTHPVATLAITGALCYLAWVVGTVVGTLGASLTSLRSAAEAVFPVAFIGLTALTASSRGIVVRSIAAAVITLAVMQFWPAGRGALPVVTALLVALPGRWR